MLSNALDFVPSYSSASYALMVSFGSVDGLSITVPNFDTSRMALMAVVACTTFGFLYFIPVIHFSLDFTQNVLIEDAA